MQLKCHTDEDIVRVMCNDAYDHLDRKYKKQHRHDNSYNQLLAELIDIEIENIKNRVVH